MKTRSKIINTAINGKGKRIGGWSESAMLKILINELDHFGGDMYSIPAKVKVTGINLKIAKVIATYITRAKDARRPGNL